MLFNDKQYVMDSETALERGYADLTLIIRPDLRQFKLLDFLMAFKYLTLKELKLSGADLKKLSTSQLMNLEVVKEKFSEAETKLKTYQYLLQQAHHHTLRLHTFSVVALGYKRLLWKALV